MDNGVTENGKLDQTLVIEDDDEEGEGQSPPLGLWAARGLLLVVAAIWGTNFAVSTTVDDSFFAETCWGT